MLVRKKSIFVCVSIIISILINYQKPLHSKEVEDIDSVISNMWDRIGNEVDGISSSKQSEYEEKLTEKFKVRGINETKLGKERIEELKTEFSKSLKKHYPKKDKAKYRSRILGVEADKRDEEINKIIQEEVNNIKSSFDNLLTNKIGEIQGEVDKVVKNVEAKFVEDLVKKITDERRKKYEELQEYIKDKVKIEKEYYSEKIKEHNKSCKLPIQKNNNLDERRKQIILSECDKLAEGLKEIFKDLDKVGKDIIYNNNGLENDIRANIEKLKKQDPSITYEKIEEEILKAVNDPLQQEGEEKIEKRSWQQDIDDSLKSMRKNFDEGLKAVEDKSAELFKEIQKLLEQKKAESKMTEEEKKQKAEAEKLQKEINSFLEKSKNMTIEDDSILKNIIKCDYKEVVHNENTNIEYCSKWVIGYSAEKIYRGISENIEDLDFKLICKTKENLKLNFSGLPKNGVFIDKKVNNISDRFVATIEDKVHYSCPSGWNYADNGECKRIVSFVCNDWHCKANQPYQAEYKVWDFYYNRLGWKIWYRRKECCVTKWWRNVEGYKCVGEGYTYVPSGVRVQDNVVLGLWSLGIHSLVELFKRPNGKCIKTETISATRHLIHIYHVNYCIPRIRDNINLGKLYDPNFVMFQ